ncbi:unnamed protein product [Mesocestoides corti]|uniref:Uncharacterized protein n=1 Tax=Mesocestoides corti TaxID=53468 RepID=A0A0R3UPX1_MESCO|nr:unnamed protein product [Mesocestoides corti]
MKNDFVSPYDRFPASSVGDRRQTTTGLQMVSIVCCTYSETEGEVVVVGVTVVEVEAEENALVLVLQRTSDRKRLANGVGEATLPPQTQERKRGGGGGIRTKPDTVRRTRDGEEGRG